MTRANTLLGVLLLSGTVSAQDDVQARMQAWSRALGVECTHCHVDGAWTDASKPVFEFAQRMNRMVSALNAGPLKDVASISCWTCHRGRTAPPRLPRESWEKIRAEHIGRIRRSAEPRDRDERLRGVTRRGLRALPRIRPRAKHQAAKGAGPRTDAADLRRDSEALRARMRMPIDAVLHVPPGPRSKPRTIAPISSAARTRRACGRSTAA